MSQAIFFDLDGTLTDPKEGITRCIRHALHKLELDCPDDDGLTWCIGPPLLDSFRTLAGDELAPEAIVLYRERFADVGWQENYPYPGIVAALQELYEQGADLFVATSKPHVFANRILGHFELAAYFKCVFGSELDGTRSNKDDLLCYALGETGVRLPAIMIGDRRHDVTGAKSNGMTAIGVTWGYGSRSELEGAGADRIVDAPGDLRVLIA